MNRVALLAIVTLLCGVAHAATLLGDADLRALGDALGKLHGHFMDTWSRRADAVDVEFLIAGDDRHVVILQARPYRVVYSKGQRLDDVPQFH